MLFRSLGAGALLPGPDYEAAQDPTYRDTIALSGGPATSADWQALDTFEVALNEASGELWRSLPGIVAEEFPSMTEGERNLTISDFQDAVATATLMRESSTSPGCVEIYQSQDGGATGMWTPLCDHDFGPGVEGAVPAIVAAVAVRVAWVAGRWLVKRAAPVVARFVTQRALPAVRAAAGRAVSAVRAAMPVVRMRAAQIGMWARQQAGAGWNFVKQKYQQAKWWQRFAFEEAVSNVGDAYRWAHQQLFGATETTTTEATRLINERPESLDAVFDL